jgi:hypothetical protein
MKRSIRVRCVLIGLASVSAGAILLATCSSSSGKPVTQFPALQVSFSTETAAPGEIIVATVQGCPREGTLRSKGDEIHLGLAPSDGNMWGPTLFQGKISFNSTSKITLGESHATGGPSSSGGAEIEVAVADNAIAGMPLFVTVVCTTLLRKDPEADRLEQGSIDAATAVAGPLTVE